MTLNEYQIAAQRTSSEKFADIDAEGLNLPQLENGLMGLCGEAGECMELLKKHRHQGHELNEAALKVELGDVAWYLAEAASALNLWLDDVAAANIAKLRKRYPLGFTAEQSINRD